MIDEQIEQVRKAKEGTGISRLIYEVISRLMKIEKYIQLDEDRAEKKRIFLNHDAKDATTAMKSMFEDMDNLHSGENSNPMATIMMAIQKFNDMSKEKLDRVKQYEKDDVAISYDKIQVTDEEVAKLMDEWADKYEDSGVETIDNSTAVGDKLAGKSSTTGTN